MAKTIRDLQAGDAVLLIMHDSDLGTVKQLTDAGTTDVSIGSWHFYRDTGVWTHDSQKRVPCGYPRIEIPDNDSDTPDPNPTRAANEAAIRDNLHRLTPERVWSLRAMMESFIREAEG